MACLWDHPGGMADHRCQHDYGSVGKRDAGAEGNTQVKPTCPFCELPRERNVASNQQGVVVRDAFPISPGHTLVIPRRHVGSLFEIDAKERDALFRLFEDAKRRLDKDYKPDGYNIGINDGPAAGQTVAHLHIHLIPRYAGDREDPRGGVRWIITEKAKYWSP